MHSNTIFLVSALALFSAHCGQSVAGALPDPTPPAQFASREESAFWSLIDARNIALTVALVSPDSERCATRTTTGSTTILTGTPCVSSNASYAGTIHVTGDPLTSPSATVEYREWSQRLSLQCARTNERIENRLTTRGTVHVIARGNIRDFDVDLTGDGFLANTERCTTSPATYALRYRGSADFGPNAPQRSYRAALRASGSGTISFTPYGRIDTTTRDLVFDPTICAIEPASGTLEMLSARRQGLLRYDGATRCGDSASNATAPFTLDGISMGELPVGTCSVRPNHRQARSGPLAVLLVAVSLAAQQLRARTRHSPKHARP